MRDFDYVRPETLDEALTALRRPSVRIMSGGQSLIPAMRSRVVAPQAIVDISRIESLKGLRREGSTILVGAGTSYSRILESDVFRRSLPAFAGAIEEIADPSIRHRATLGGAIAENHPAADSTAILVALDAEVRTVRRTLSVEALLRGAYATSLVANEMIVEICIPVVDRLAYKRIRDPASRFAVSGVAVAIQGSVARVAVTGGTRGVFRWAEAEARLRDHVWPGALDDIVLSSRDFSSDHRASAEYRAHVASVLARRALSEALEL